MILKYFYRTFGILLLALLLASCLNSNVNEINPSKDAQIHSFKITSATDSNKYLDAAKFSIDQINERIFNRDSLPYLFDVDSILVNIGTNSGFSDITFKLDDKDSTYTWNNKDSVGLHSLKTIETTAGDGRTKMSYRLSINVHKQDPFLINWNKISGAYVTNQVSQKTIAFKDKFVTYYKTPSGLYSVSADATTGTDWIDNHITGLGVTTDLSSIISIVKDKSQVLYVLDEDGTVYTSNDATTWNQVGTQKIETIYGELPNNDKKLAILLAVNDNGVIKFATTEDFSSIDILNNIPEDMPMNGFSVVNVVNAEVYTAKYIVLYGGQDVTGVTRNSVWMMELNKKHRKGEEGKVIEYNEISTIEEELNLEIEDATLFLYDSNIFMFALEEGKNKMYFSEDYGLSWKWGGEGQEIDEDLTPRTETSIITDKNNFIWIFGGKSKASIQISDVWRGRLNRLAE